MTQTALLELWNRTVEEFVASPSATPLCCDFFRSGVDRVELVREALGMPGGNSRAAAVALLKRMTVEERQQLLPELIQLARSVHGPITAVRDIIASLPREWTLTQIDNRVEPILRDEQYDDYWMFLDLYELLDKTRAVKLAGRAAAHADAEIRELGEGRLAKLGARLVDYKIQFVVAPDHLLALADEILRANIRCAAMTRREIRAVAKAYIDEADEMTRSAYEVQTGAARIQIQSISPPEMIAKAKRLRTIRLKNEELQVKVRKVAESYVLIAEKNQQLYDEFKKKYRGHLPPTSD